MSAPKHGYFKLTHPDYGTYYATTAYKAEETIGCDHTYIYEAIKHNKTNIKGWGIEQISKSDLDHIEYIFIDKKLNEIICQKTKSMLQGGKQQLQNVVVLH